MSSNPDDFNVGSRMSSKMKPELRPQILVRMWRQVPSLSKSFEFLIGSPDYRKVVTMDYHFAEELERNNKGPEFRKID